MRFVVDLDTKERSTKGEGLYMRKIFLEKKFAGALTQEIKEMSLYTQMERWRIRQSPFSSLFMVKEKRKRVF